MSRYAHAPWQLRRGAQPWSDWARDPPGRRPIGGLWSDVDGTRRRIRRDRAAVSPL